MFIRHLSLSNFRNYAQLEFDIPPRIAVLQGENAQGKSNLLEAIYILATSRSNRTSTERDLINWSAFGETLPVCRLAADIQRGDRNLRLEVALMAKDTGPHRAADSFYPGPIDARIPSVQKRIRVNGSVRRAVDLVGQINVVTFSILDIDVIRGEPAVRRRHLDITISQIDPHYLRQLQRYQRILWQRNRLLRQIAQRQASPDELSFWDVELVQSGTYLMVQREHTIAALNHHTEIVHDELSGGLGKLRLSYCRSIDKEKANGDSHTVETSEAFGKALQAKRHKELAQGMSLVGPHRDDLRFLINEVDMGIYGSRGQQRTAALSLKLAEAKFMLSITEQHPILLLDDVLSELDSRRRSLLLRAAAAYEQVLLTTTDLDRFEPGFLAQAQLFKVVEGRIQPLST
ncbi:MAG: DNA replication/repair protein RecF [Dehalococcoidia bacterium]